MAYKIANRTFLVTFLLAFNYTVGWIPCKQQDQYGRRLLAWSTKNSAPSPKPSKAKYFIPTEQIEELREVVDIVSVIESYDLPKFKRNGDRATCLCPFHDDHNPSMNIDGNKGIYKCFSCGAGGNVYNFIQEYSKLEGEEVSFPRAVQMVKENFAPVGVGPSIDFNINHSRDSEYHRAEQAKKERLIKVNLAAAAYFEKTLVSMAGAGKARAYLRERRLNPSSVRAFSIGYAPDCYFRQKRNRSRKWGQGSLVSCLRQQNFTAQEIFDAGLATKTNVKTKAKQNMATKPKGGIHYSNIIDRFRDRIIVPIFDSTGKSVVGFGGRILDRMDTKADNKAPKYLNSPESLVFKKQEVLFGQHMAKKSVRFWANKDSESNHPVLIVEGYMDVIALWQVGIREAVASMGTSLTAKQLNVAAAIAGKKNGHVVLCLDNDDAGLNAIERLCSGKVLHDLTERHLLEIRVASLPAGVKDPAEFIEHFPEEENVENLFRTEVIAEAVEWSDWYVKRVLKSYNPDSSRGTFGSFGDVFQRVASFLANYKNPADRTKQACEVARYLGSIIAKSDNKTQVSNAVLIQLETDLVEKAAAIADSKAAISNRQSLSSVGKRAIESQLFDVTHEDDNLGVDERSKLSSEALRQIGDMKEGRQEQFGARSIYKDDEEKESFARGFRFKIPRAPKSVPDFTPHFKGFDFDENDEKWLGLFDEKGRKKNHYLLPKGAYNKFGEINEFGQKKPIYFNSNDYHGNQFLTTEAMLAGYKAENVRRDPEIFMKGVASLLQRDPSKVCLDAEDSLLHMLLLYAQARKAVKTILDIGRVAHSIEGVPLEWSSNAKRWLFHVLVEKESSIPAHINGPSGKEELYKYLKQCIEESSAVTPSANYSKSEEVVRIESVRSFQDEPMGSVRDGMTETLLPMNNRLFSDEGPTLSEIPKIEEVNFIFYSNFDPPGDFGTVSIDYDDEMLELSAQQLYSSLLLASARRQLSFLQDNLATTLKILYKPANETNISEEDLHILLSDGNNTRLDDECIQLLNGTLKEKETKEFCDTLASKISEATQAISRIAESNSRLSQRLTDVALSRQIEEGEISHNDYEILKRKLDENMLEITQLLVHEGPDESEAEEAYEEVLERAQLNWGKLYDDEYMWSPKDAREGPLMQNEAAFYSQEDPMKFSEPVDEESLEEFNARMEKSWGWLDKKSESETDDSEDESRLYTFDQGKWDDLLRNQES